MSSTKRLFGALICLQEWGFCPAPNSCFKYGGSDLPGIFWAALKDLPKRVSRIICPRNSCSVVLTKGSSSIQIPSAAFRQMSKSAQGLASLADTAPKATGPPPKDVGAHCCLHCRHNTARGSPRLHKHRVDPCPKQTKDSHMAVSMLIWSASQHDALQQLVPRYRALHPHPKQHLPLGQSSLCHPAPGTRRYPPS